MSETKLFNMCMIQEKNNDQVVVINRVKKDWPGITFPGGKVEDGESVVQSTIREVQEETGLSVSDLTLKGIVHWYHLVTHARWIIFLYKAGAYSGNIIKEGVEGEVAWVPIKNLKEMKLADGLLNYLTIFEGEQYTEAFGTWKDTLINKFVMY